MPTLPTRPTQAKVPAPVGVKPAPVVKPPQAVTPLKPVAQSAGIGQQVKSLAQAPREGGIGSKVSEMAKKIGGGISNVAQAVIPSRSFSVKPPAKSLPVKANEIAGKMKPRKVAPSLHQPDSIPKNGWSMNNLKDR